MKSILKIVAESKFRFLIVSVILGVIFSFLCIPWQVPDEYTHLCIIGGEIGNDKLAPTLLGEVNAGYERIIGNPDEKISKAEIRKAMAKPAEYDRSDCLIKGFSVKAIRHLPAIMGIQIGVLLHLPAYWVLQLGELFALAFYIFLGYLAISIAKYRPWVFEMILLLPMSMHQAASLNYDAVLIPVCVFFVSYILSLKDRAVICLKQLCVIPGLLLVIALIKIPYVLLGLLIFILPFESFQLKLFKSGFTIRNPKRAKIVLGALLVVASFLALILLRDLWIVRVLKACMSHPYRTVLLIKSSCLAFYDSYITSLIGTFGWMDTPLPGLVAYGGFAVIILFSMCSVVNSSNMIVKSRVRLSGYHKLVFAIVTIGLALLIVLSMIDHSAQLVVFGDAMLNIRYIDYDEALFLIPNIGGIQGRYLIPAFLTFLMILPDWFEIRDKRFAILLWVLAIVNMIACAGTLYGRFFL